MNNKKQLLAAGSAVLLCGVLISAAEKKEHEPLVARAALGAVTVDQFWRERDITSCNLYYGPGGPGQVPHGPFRFLEEDLDGTNPKFDIRDADGVKWKVKLGSEARPETASSRLVWAAGYFANENYFVSNIKIDNLPVHLHRGQHYVQPDGSIRNVRLKRYRQGEKKIGNWQWANSPFAGSREFDGLRVLMALLNNWDLTDENNAIYEERAGDEVTPSRIFMVSDLGSTFGAPGLTWPLRNARGNLDVYRQSTFITFKTSETIDFGSPHRDSLVFLATPREYMQKLRLQWIGKRIPRDHARWLGQQLARLSQDQIRDAFRAAGYTTEEVEGFTAVVQIRIAELQGL